MHGIIGDHDSGLGSTEQLTGCPNKLLELKQKYVGDVGSVEECQLGFLPTSFRDLSSSQLKLLSRRARKRFSTMKFPMTRAGRNMARQDSATP